MLSLCHIRPQGGEPQKLAEWKEEKERRKSIAKAKLGTPEAAVASLATRPFAIPTADTRRSPFFTSVNGLIVAGK